MLLDEMECLEHFQSGFQHGYGTKTTLDDLRRDIKGGVHPSGLALVLELPSAG